MIEIRNVSKTFQLKDKDVKAVDDVSLKVSDGEIFGVIGYSGAGKSTLVRCINFLEIPDTGEISVSGFGTVTVRNGKLYFREEGKEARAENEVLLSSRKLNELREGIGMIFQHFNLLDRSTVYENVAFPLKHKKSKAETDAKVKELLDLVGLKDKMNSYPSELSGGQKQRVAIARALANDPKILLSDEATSALDPDVTESILKLLSDLNKKLGVTIILITHEMQVIKEICQRVAVMENGRVVEEGDVYDVFSHPAVPITRRFVTSSNGLTKIGRLMEEEPAMFRSDEGSRVLRLQFDKNSVGDAMISEVSRRYSVGMNIILANVEILQGSPLGTMIVKITGEKNNIEQAVDYMRGNQVEVEVIEYERNA